MSSPVTMRISVTGSSVLNSKDSIAVKEANNTFLNLNYL